MTSSSKSDERATTRLCPRCRESISSAATVCKFCRRDLGSRRFPLLPIGALIALVALPFASCTNTVPSPRGVKYSVGGSASRASMTYSGAGGSTLQAGDSSLPWSHSVIAHAGDFVYLSAQNAGSTGCVRVTITVDGDELETGQSCGAFVIATVSATLK